MAANACETIAAPSPAEATVSYHLLFSAEQFLFSSSNAIGRFRNPFNPPFQTPTHHVDDRKILRAMIDPTFEVFRGD